MKCSEVSWKEFSKVWEFLAKLWRDFKVINSCSTHKWKFPKFWSNGIPSIAQPGMESAPRCSKLQRGTLDRIVGKKADINCPETKTNRLAITYLLLPGCDDP